MLIEFDSTLRSRLSHLPSPGNSSRIELTGWTGSENLILKDGSRLDRFALREHSQQGSRLRLLGVAEAQIEKSVEVELLPRYPGFAIYRVSYRNLASYPIAIRGWSNAELQLPPAARRGHAQEAEPDFWSYCGSTHSDRRDWVQPVRPGFEQQNFMGMEASDYGGGTPIVDVWRRDCGLALGHLESTPELVSLPVRCSNAFCSPASSSRPTKALSPFTPAIISACSTRIAGSWPNGALNHRRHLPALTSRSGAPGVTSANALCS